MRHRLLGMAGQGSSITLNDHNRGTAYLASRLKRDNPELAADVIAGHISAPCWPPAENLGGLSLYQLPICERGLFRQQQGESSFGQGNGTGRQSLLHGNSVWGYHLPAGDVAAC